MALLSQLNQFPLLDLDIGDLSSEVLDRLSPNAGWSANNCANLSKVSGDFKPSTSSMVASSPKLLTC
jgi:hypothetical protein